MPNVIVGIGGTGGTNPKSATGGTSCTIRRTGTIDVTCAGGNAGSRGTINSTPAANNDQTNSALGGTGSSFSTAKDGLAGKKTFIDGVTYGGAGGGGASIRTTGRTNNAKAGTGGINGGGNGSESLTNPVTSGGVYGAGGGDTSVATNVGGNGAPGVVFLYWTP